MKIPVRIISPVTKSQVPEELKLGNQKTAKIWEKISKTAIYLLVFLVPIFFLPFTLDVLDFNKQFLMGILVTIALISWLVKVLVSGELEFNLNFLNIPVVIFLLVYGISTIFSLSPRGSFFGWPLNTGQGFLTLLYFILFYFLVANIFKKEEVFKPLFIFLISGFLVTLFSIFQIFGKFLLPWDFTKITSFNTIGSVNSLSIFLAILLPLTILFSYISRWFFRWILAIFAIFFLISLFLINFPTAWLVLISGFSMIFIFTISSIKREERNSALIFLSTFFLIISLFSIAFRISLPGVQIPIEVLPTQRAELNIARKLLPKTLFLGTGPSTFVFNFSKFKPVEINQTAFWNFRFSSGASEILDKLVTTGFLGIISLFFIFGVFFWLAGKNLIKTENPDWLFSLGIFSSFFGLVFSQFLYPANFTLLFSFWLILGSFSVLTPKIKSWVFKSPSQILLASFIFLLVFLFSTGISFLLVKNYFAEVKYLSGLRAWQRGETEQAINGLLGAINLNPGLDSYFRDISQLYLIRLNEIFQRRDLSPEELANQSKILMRNATNSAIRATDLSPENVANWNVRGFIYRNLIGLVGGVEDWAESSYQKSIELEPTNPYIFVEIGRIFLAKTDLFSQQGKEKEMAENLAKAKEKFQRALELKPDYPPAHFQIAMIYVREGKTKEAIEKLEETKSLSPFDIGLAFQLSLIYYNDNQFDKAKEEFERAVRIDENYSNARYFLGLIYDREGKKSEAISQFEKIEKLNPENLEVKKILANLREGKSALEGIIPGRPPIEEIPPERLEK